MVTTLSPNDHDLIDMYEAIWKSTKIGDLWLSNERWCDGEEIYVLVLKKGFTPLRGWHPNYGYWIEVLSLHSRADIRVLSEEFVCFEQVTSE